VAELEEKEKEEVVELEKRPRRNQNSTEGIRLI